MGSDQQGLLTEHIPVQKARNPTRILMAPVWQMAHTWEPPNITTQTRPFARKKGQKGREKKNKQTKNVVFGNILKNVIWQEGGPFPLVSTCVAKCSRAFKKSSGGLPTSPRPSPFFKINVPRFKLVIVQRGLANS